MVDIVLSKSINHSPQKRPKEKNTNQIKVTFPCRLPLPSSPPLLTASHYSTPQFSLRVRIHPVPPSPPPGFETSLALLLIKRQKSEK